jgi:hypothetical protein
MKFTYKDLMKDYNYKDGDIIEVLNYSNPVTDYEMNREIALEWYLKRTGLDKTIEILDVFKYTNEWWNFKADIVEMTNKYHSLLNEDAEYLKLAMNAIRKGNPTNRRFFMCTGDDEINYALSNGFDTAIYTYLYASGTILKNKKSIDIFNKKVEELLLKYFGNNE